MRDTTTRAMPSGAMTSRRPPPGRPPKRKRTDAELQELARRLGADWTPGDAVQTWIHQHEGKTGELSRMVEAGWLWEDIGRAMYLAGITYRTGQPIPARTLRLKAYLSRNRERDRAAAAATRQAPRPAPAMVVHSAVEEVAAENAAEPSFPLVSLKGGPPPAAPSPPPNRPPQEPSAMPKLSDEDILRRVFGKP